jgi:hypothetical protein
MNRVVSSAVVVAGLVFTLGGAASWGQVPSTNDTSDAKANTGSGTGTLSTNTTGYQNTASGFRALFLNTTGHENTASGFQALWGNDTGSYNTASGVSALVRNDTGSGNTASGYNALADNTTGRVNTASGFRALASNSAGSYNTALGYQALSNSTGSRNLALGYQAGYNLSSGDKNIYVGNTGAASESNTMRLGRSQTRTFIAGVYGVAVGNGSPKPVYINSSGQLGTSTQVILSSARYKRDIADMKDGSQGLYSLRPVTFRYKQDAQGQRQYGLIAEEVVKVYPELVTKGAEGKMEGVQYEELIPMLLNEVQHQQQEIVELKAQNEEQRVQNAALEARLERLEQGATRTATAATR